MAKVIIYPSMHGVLCVENPKVELPDDKLEQLAELIVPAPRPWAIVDASTLPQDRSFRKAWRCNYTGNNVSGVTIDLEVAKEIQRDKWRAARKPLLEKLDVEFMRALESGDTDRQIAIATRKQELRDVTDTDLSEYSALEDLKAVWPSVLNPV